MTRVLVTLGLFAVFSMPTLGAGPWVTVAEKLQKSVMQISNVCSGFVINEEKKYALTAKHCGNDDPSKPVVIDLVPATVVATDVQYDLLVLHVPGLDRPAIYLADEDVQTGEEVVSWGFGGGYPRGMLRHAWVSQSKAIVPDAAPEEWVLFDSAFVGGQSGGAVVNEKGEVVAIVQMSSDRMALGRGVSRLKDRVGKYWGKPKAEKP